MAVSIYEAKSQLSKLIAEVERTGGEIVISRHNVPVAKLVPFRPVIPPRELGGWEGSVEIAEDFDELPTELAAAFLGEDQPSQPR
ncbi:MAG: type II toxin-antitoxin system prevent-host-death family antitoxin [Ilumatobacteraceae bacterium]